MRSMASPRKSLPTEELSAAAFSPFGEVIAARADVQTFAINAGFATRFHDLARVDVGAQGGAVCVSIFQALPRTLPLQLSVMERHPLGSQAFVAMGERPFLVVVAPPTDVLELSRIRCFVARPGQGVNYARGVWHHPLIALQRASDFLVIDRSGGEAGHSNLDEVDVRAAALWVGA
jgi:ureidoglycolate lyase